MIAAKKLFVFERLYFVAKSPQKTIELASRVGSNTQGLTVTEIQFNIYSETGEAL